MKLVGDLHEFSIPTPKTDKELLPDSKFNGTKSHLKWNRHCKQGLLGVWLLNSQLVGIDNDLIIIIPTSVSKQEISFLLNLFLVPKERWNEAVSLYPRCR